VKNISPEEKILRKKLRNREAAQLSRDKKKAQFNILSGMVHGLRKENVQLKQELEVLRFNQEQLIIENERLREQLSTESSIPKSVVTETNTTAAKDRISIEGPAEGQTESNILFDALLSDSVPITDYSILHDLKLPDDDNMDWFDNSVSKRLEKIADELLGESFLNECCLDEMVGSTSEVLESCENIDDIHNTDIKNEPLFMLNTDTKTVNEETKPKTENIVIKSEVEDFEDESNALERFIIVEEAIEEVTTTYDEHILEICQEDDNMDTEQYEDFGYESLSSPEYDYRTHYTPHTLTDLI
jgi:hypothetical protein